MTDDNVVSLHLVEKAELKEPDVWVDAAKVAMEAGAVFGVLIYVDSAGDTSYISIGAERASMRGMVEEIRDDLRGV
jgi:hypothetical protein